VVKDELQALLSHADTRNVPTVRPPRARPRCSSVGPGSSASSSVGAGSPWRNFGCYALPHFLCNCCNFGRAPVAKCCASVMQAAQRPAGTPIRTPTRAAPGPDCVALCEAFLCEQDRRVEPPLARRVRAGVHAIHLAASACARGQLAAGVMWQGDDPPFPPHCSTESRARIPLAVSGPRQCQGSPMAHLPVECFDGLRAR
jgi:hypothetical protein